MSVDWCYEESAVDVCFLLSLATCFLGSVVFLCSVLFWVLIVIAMQVFCLCECGKGGFGWFLIEKHFSRFS